MAKIEVSGTRTHWKCPKCSKYNRVRGIGEKVRRCRCGFKTLIETEFEKEWRLVSKIQSAEEV